MGGGIFDLVVDETSFHIDFTNLVLLIIFATSLRGVYLVAEFYVMRKKLREPSPVYPPAPKTFPPYHPSYSQEPQFQIGNIPSNQLTNIPPPQYQPTNIPPPPPPQNQPNHLPSTKENIPNIVAPKKVERKTLREEDWLD